MIGQPHSRGFGVQRANGLNSRRSEDRAAALVDRRSPPKPGQTGRERKQLKPFAEQVSVTVGHNPSVGLGGLKGFSNAGGDYIDVYEGARRDYDNAVLLQAWPLWSERVSSSPARVIRA